MKSNQREHGNCSHAHKHDSPPADNEVEHLIALLQQKFISPYKLIYMIDQKQADFFKIRNKLDGCCSNSDITIPKDDMTKIEKAVAEKVSRGYLLIKLGEILEYCQERFENIRKDGEKSNLEFNKDVEKFLLDKVLSESVNTFLFKEITKQLHEENHRISSQIGLWATPATWYAQYPNTPLNFLSSETISELVNRGIAVSRNYLVDEKENLADQLTLIEKDGKFQEKLWKDDSRNDCKILTSPEMYVGRDSSTRFPKLQTTLAMMKAVPFELNAKMNAFCTISESVHISYFKEKGFHHFHKENGSKYSLFSCIGSKCGYKTKTQSQEGGQISEGTLNEGDLLLIDNLKKSFQFTTESRKGHFVLRLWITCIKKQQ